MALKKIAVQGLTLAHGPGSLAAGGTFTVTSTPSTDCKVDGNGIYRGTLNFTWSGGTYNGFPGASGSGSISPTATKDTADGQVVVREEDSGTMSGTYTNPSPPPPTLPFSGASVKVSAAGQSEVTGE